MHETRCAVHGKLDRSAGPRLCGEREARYHGQVARAEQTIGEVLGTRSIGAAREAMADVLGAPPQPLVTAGILLHGKVELRRTKELRTHVNTGVLTDAQEKEGTQPLQADTLPSVDVVRHGIGEERRQI